MFKMEFKVVEILSNGVTITHYLKGTRRAVERDIKNFKANSRRYELFGKEGMVVWA
jgi:hypothetical protein